MQWLPQLVVRRGREHPCRLAYRFFQGKGEPQTLTYGELWRSAATLAERFAEYKWRGERVLLACKSERNFVVAFYACLMAGVIAVPTAPPRRQALHGRLQLLIKDACAAAIVCDFDEVAQIGFDVASLGLVVLDVRVVQSWETNALSFEPVAVDGGDLAFLQYTSGSTGDPKGVAISHANLIDNSESIRISMGMSESSSVLIGLPLFHDMGLVGGVLQSMYVGCTTNFLPPAELVQYPERWLELISSLRITTSGGPNFIYELVANEVREEDLRDLDLSSWEVAFCGAEPIRARTIMRFTQRFGPIGFRPGAFHPCYGMAEATLFISGKRLGEVPTTSLRDGVEVVCCGESAPGTSVRIVDPQTCNAVAEGEIGEIWVIGRGVARGYWMRELQSAEVFRARIKGEGDAAYLRTGDLGWIEKGHLYVSSRLKDLIIVNGRNFPPQDIEEAAEGASAAVCQGGVAAFAVAGDGATDRLIVVAELERRWVRRESEWPLLASTLRAAIHAAQGLVAAEVIFIKPGSLPRTSSGKVRRSQCRADYLSGVIRCAPVQSHVCGENKGSALGHSAAVSVLPTSNREE